MEVVEHRFPFKPLSIFAIGDLQGTGKGFARARFKRYVDRCAERGGWWVGLGDYSDWMSPSNRQSWLAANHYDTSKDMAEDIANIEAERFIEVIKPIKDRCLGLLQGHHFFPSENGETTDTLIAKKIGAPYLGTMAFIILRFISPSRVVLTSRIVAWHGEGGGALAGAAINKIDKMAVNYDADAYLMGHTTRRGAVDASRLGVNGALDIVDHDIWLLNTGGWSKAYEKGSTRAGRAEGSYVEKRGMRPAALGGLVLELYPCRGKDSWIESGVWLPPASAKTYAWGKE